MKRRFFVGVVFVCLFGCGAFAVGTYDGGSGTLAAEASGTTTITVNDARQFCTGMLIKVGTEDNSGSGFLINTINYGTDQLTLNAQVTSQSSGAAVIPLPLTATTAGDVIPIIVGNVKLGTDTILLTSCGFDIDPKAALRNDEFGTESASGSATAIWHRSFQI